MRKFSIALFTAVFMMSFCLAAHAQEQSSVKGTVTKIDNTSVTIKTKEGKEVTVVMQNPALLSRVKQGEKAEAKYVVKDGVNSGVKLRKLIEGCE